MKMIRNLEDSTTFLLVINQGVQENTSSEQQPFPGDPNSTLGVGAGEDPALRTKKQSVRGKRLKSRRPYGIWNRNHGALVP